MFIEKEPYLRTCDSDWSRILHQHHLSIKLRPRWGQSFFLWVFLQILI